VKIVCSWCKKQVGVKEPMEDTRISHTICEDCVELFKDDLHEQAPEVADEDEMPCMIFKCGCMYGGGSRFKTPHFIKLCWKHGG
jgi:hypothetical protein